MRECYGNMLTNQEQCTGDVLYNMLHGINHMDSPLCLSLCVLALTMHRGYVNMVCSGHQEKVCYISANNRSMGESNVHK